MSKETKENRPVIDKVKFKSVMPYYQKEKLGFKPNTERELDMNDSRFMLLYDWSRNMTNETWKVHIIIESPEFNERFEREITDVSFWKGLCIISWKHERSAYAK